MSEALSDAGNELISKLKRDGILMKFKPWQIASYGGVAVICADGDIDAEPFHRRVNPRLNAVKFFGGPLLLAPSFSGYDADFAQKIIENIMQGIKIKGTDSALYLYFHAPCGMATAYNHSILDVIKMALEVKKMFRNMRFFEARQTPIGSFFHVRRVVNGYLEQNTYIFR